MVENFFQRAKDYYTAPKDDQVEQDAAYRDRRVQSDYEDRYSDPNEQKYYGNLSPSREDSYSDRAEHDYR